MKVTENVYWLSGGPYAAAGNVWGIRCEQGVVLVDTGIPSAERIIENNLELDGLAELPVTHVLLTHAHYDHTGSAAYFQKKGAEVIIGAGDAPTLENGDFLKPMPYAGYMDSAFAPCRPDRVLEGDCSLELSGRLFDCLHLPGHTPGSTVFVTEITGKRAFFTGDLIYCEDADGTPMQVWAGDPGYCRETVIQSMEKLYAMQIDMMFGGHGIPRLAEAMIPLRNTYREYLLAR